jgi:hypothetical protein
MDHSLSSRGSTSSLAVIGTTIFAGIRFVSQSAIDTTTSVVTHGEVFLSTNNGTSWTAVNSGLTDAITTDFAVCGSALFAATDKAGVFLSTNIGARWTAVNSGLTDTIIKSLAVSGTTIYARTESGIWRRPLSEMINVTGAQPQRETLQKAHVTIRAPGRTNPDVLIELSLPRSEHVVVRIFDLCGREIASLVNKQLPAGSYGYRWNTRDISTGCYTVRVRAGSRSYGKNITVFR